MKNFLIILGILLFSFNAEAQIANYKNKVIDYEENLVVASSKPKDFKCLSIALYVECRACSGLEIQTLAEIFVNRTNNENFPNSICNVIDHKSKNYKQFPWVYNKSVFRKFSIKEIENWKRVQKYAYLVLENNDDFDISKGGIYFTRPHEVQSWTKKLEVTAVLPYHIVYKNKD